MFTYITLFKSYVLLKSGFLFDYFFKKQTITFLKFVFLYFNVFFSEKYFIEYFFLKFKKYLNFSFIIITFFVNEFVYAIIGGIFVIFTLIVVLLF